jgi:hypothetical protein
MVNSIGWWQADHNAFAGLRPPDTRTRRADALELPQVLRAASVANNCQDLTYEAMLGFVVLLADAPLTLRGFSVVFCER